MYCWPHWTFRIFFLLLRNTKLTTSNKYANNYYALCSILCCYCKRKQSIVYNLSRFDIFLKVWFFPPHRLRPPWASANLSSEHLTGWLQVTILFKSQFYARNYVWLSKDMLHYNWNHLWNTTSPNDFYALLYLTCFGLGQSTPIHLIPFKGGSTF